MQDLELYAEQDDVTLTVPHFVNWLLINRPQLKRMNTKDLEIMAQESLTKFAHAAIAPPREK
ncbi:MAG: hypothetical protein ACI8PT_003876 [Gammaproteobacteria bacterium]|jgi:hypothetical protein